VFRLKIAVEASRGARWRLPLLIFHRVVFFSAMSNFSTQAPVVVLSTLYGLGIKTMSLFGKRCLLQKCVIIALEVQFTEKMNNSVILSFYF
jgi:hypothetical protein